MEQRYLRGFQHEILFELENVFIADAISKVYKTRMCLSELFRAKQRLD